MKKNLTSVGIIIVLLVLFVIINGIRAWNKPQVTPSPTPTETPVVNDLIQNPWIWLQTENGEGQVISPATTSKPFIITFGADGRFNLSTDCNAHSGAYAVDGENIVFGSIISTKMFCEGSRENEFVQWLASSTSYHVTDNSVGLSLLVDGGAAQVIFQKKLVTSFEECAAAGNPIMESYPEQCRTPDGRSFTRNIGTSTIPTTLPTAIPLPL